MRRRVRGVSLTFLELDFVGAWVLICAAQLMPAKGRHAQRAKTRRRRLPLNIWSNSLQESRNFDARSVPARGNLTAWPALLIVRNLPIFHNSKVSIGENGLSDLTYSQPAT